MLTPALLILAGLGAALGQAPWNLWFMAAPAYALGLWVLSRSGRPARAGWLIGAAHFGLSLHWITEPFFVNAAKTGWLAPVALVSLAGGMAIFWGLAGWAGRKLGGGAFGMAVMLAAAELTRAYIFTGFPWALPGHTLIVSPALPAAALLGAHGLGLCVLLGAGLVASGRAVPAAFGVALWALPFGLAAALSPAPLAGPDAPVVRLVQPNAPQHLKWNPEWIGTFFRRGLAATAAPIEGPPPSLTVWPETSLPELLEYSE
ncbi:MAG: apolipoprotein N-acyltransferase, partial [Jannaschia sp.]